MGSAAYTKAINQRNKSGTWEKHQVHKDVGLGHAHASLRDVPFRAASRSSLPLVRLENHESLRSRSEAHPRAVASNKERDVAGTRVFSVYIKMFCLLALVPSDRQSVR